MEGTKYMMVLADGSTFTDLDGCTIVAVPASFEADTIDVSEHDTVAAFDVLDNGTPVINMAAPGTAAGYGVFPIGPATYFDYDGKPMLYGLMPGDGA